MKDDASDPTRARILRAATELFATRGFRPTSIRAICGKAGVNVASVNYYFRSKEGLYVEVFRALFDGFRKPLLAMPDRIHDARSWKAALKEWVEFSLRMNTSDDPPDMWVAQLIAHERTNPTTATPILYRQFFEPLKQAVERIVRMGMPRDSSDVDVHLVAVSLLAQCAVYQHHKPPWDKLLIPSHVDHEQWVARATQFIVESITSRFSFKAVTRSARQLKPGK